MTNIKEHPFEYDKIYKGRLVDKKTNITSKSGNHKYDKYLFKLSNDKVVTIVVVTDSNSSMAVKFGKETIKYINETGVTWIRMRLIDTGEYGQLWEAKAVKNS